MSLIAGWLPVLVVLVLFARVQGWRRSLADVPIAAALGLGAASLTWWVVLLISPSTSGTGLAIDLAIWIALLVAAIAWPARRFAPVPPPRGNGSSVKAVAAALALFVPLAALATVAFAATTAVAPHGAWDAWAIWNLRAAFFFDGLPAAWRAAFQPGLGWSHPDYPLLVPLAVARAWTYAGSIQTAAPTAIAAAFAAATVVTVLRATADRRGLALGLVAASAVVAAPIFVTSAASQQADVPLAFFMLATFAWLDRGASGDRPGFWHALAGFSAGLAAWTKNEGILFLAIVGVLVVVASMRARSTAAGGRFAMKAFAIGAAAPLLALLSFKFGFAPPNDLASAMGGWPGPAVAIDPGRYATALAALGRELWSNGAATVGVLPLVVLFWLLAGWRRPETPVPIFGFAAMVLLVAGYAEVYVRTPHDLVWHLDASAARLMCQPLPTVIWAALMTTRSPAARGH